MIFLAGIPWLAGAIGGLFTAVFSWFVTFLGKRFAIVLAAVVVIGTITAALFAALRALMLSLAVAVPDYVSIAAGLFLPSNIDDCVVAYLSARLLRYGYDWNIKIIQYKLF